ncbi:hypothetical protein ACSU1N_03610 [Thermogladius sp. 4427co]|uniref:hypothetical protein n=1 Tax=Thermogladius sp. 4427co TaxID=3450718 RepID=UPI003F798940
MLREARLLLGRDYLFSTVILALIVFFSIYANSIANSIILAPFEIAKGGGGLLIYNRGSFVITGLVPSNITSLVEAAGMLCSPEVLAPVILDESTIIARGVSANYLARIHGAILVDGALYLDNSTAIAGYRLAGKYKLSPGSVILVRSLFNNATIALRVAGIVRSGNPVDDELIVSLDTARLLRGVSASYVSVIVCDRASARAESILGNLTGTNTIGYGYSITVPGWLIPLITSRSIQVRGVLEIRSLGDVVSIGRTMSLLGLAGTVILTSIVAVVTSGFYVKRKEYVLNTLVELSLNPASIRRLALLALTSMFLTGYLLGVLLYFYAGRYIMISLLYHSLPLIIDSETLAIYTIIVSALFILVSAKEVRSIGTH